MGRLSPKSPTGRRAEKETMNDTLTPKRPTGAAAARPLSPAARRALAEAAERRGAIDARASEIAKVKEYQGRGGLEPVRYEDWEVKGRASDF
jgi:hypothetical protein